MPDTPAGQPVPAPAASALEEAVDALTAGQDASATAVVRRLSVGGSRAAVWEFDPAARELVCRQASLPDLIDRRVALGVGVVGWVASRRRHATIVDRRTDRRGDHYRGDLRIPTAGAAVPVPSDRHYIGGVLEVYGESHRSVTTSDLVALGRLAAVIAAGTRVARTQVDPATGSEDSITDMERRNAAMVAELHDGVSQRLASLSFHLAAATAALSEPAELAEPAEPPALDPGYSDPVTFAMRQLSVANDLTQLAADDVRAAIKGLRPPVLDDLGLAKGLISLCGALGAEDLTVVVDVEDVEPPFISPRASLALYRVAQEALGNAVKHAGVAAVRVQLLRRGDNVVLDVRDDGVGYQQEADGRAPASKAGTDGGLGQRSMAERMESLGGRLELWSAPGRGTHVRAIVRDEPALRR